MEGKGKDTAKRRLNLPGVGNTFPGSDPQFYPSQRHDQGQYAPQAQGMLYFHQQFREMIFDYSHNGIVYRVWCHFEHQSEFKLLAAAI